MKSKAVLLRFNRLLLAGFIAAAAALAVLQVAKAGPPSPTDVPDSIQVDTAHNKVFLIGHATGVQIYTCNGSVWSSAVPRANLYGDNGQLIIHHFKGPSWQANDGSTVVGKLDAPPLIKNQDSVAWLRLSIASRTAGPDGGDRLLDTSFIQRIHTVGGIAPPAADCNAATAGQVVEQPYTADYIFWKHTGAAAA